MNARIVSASLLVGVFVGVHGCAMDSHSRFSSAQTWDADWASSAAATLERRGRPKTGAETERTAAELRSSPELPVTVRLLRDGRAAVSLNRSGALAGHWSELDGGFVFVEDPLGRGNPPPVQRAIQFARVSQNLVRTEVDDRVMVYRAR